MPNSNKYRRTDKRPTFWVPRSFHPDITLPPRLLTHCQCAYYLMHSIVVRVAYGDRNGARLKMQYLQNTMGRHRCKPILDALINSGDVRRVGNYIEGDHSFGYLPGQQYEEDKLRRFCPTDLRLLERLDAVSREAEADAQRHWSPIHDVWQQWQTHLRLDRRQARRIIANIPLELNPYDVQTLLIERIRPGQHRFIVDDYGRVHNSITSLHRTLRPALRISGQPLVNIDIVNSQPALLAVLMHQRRSQPSTNRHATDHAPANSSSIYDGSSFPPLVGYGKNHRQADPQSTQGNRRHPDPPQAAHPFTIDILLPR